MDTVVGICVLQPIWIPGIYRLWFTAQRGGNGATMQGNIFIKDETVPGLPDKMPDCDEGSNSIWKFKRSGNHLDCHPSINWISANWHNPFNWSAEIVEMIPREEIDHMTNEPAERHRRGYTVHYDIKNELANKGNADDLIREMRAEGVLKP